MLGSKGNPQASNLFAVIHYVYKNGVFVNISDVPVNPRDYCQPLHPGCLGLVESGLGLVESGLMLVKQWFKVVQGWLKLVEKG